MLDLLLRQVRLYKKEGLNDIAIKDGRIVEIKPKIEIAALQEINAEGNFVSPGFVDAHTHLEKALTGEGMEVNSLVEAIMAFKQKYLNFTEEDFKNRAIQVVEMAVKNGTTAIRTHIYVDDVIGLKAIKAIGEVKKEVAHLVDLQIVAMPSNKTYTIDAEMLKLLEEVPALGVELFGGAPHLSADPHAFIDTIFALANKHKLAIDFHVDETDEPTVKTLEYIAEKTILEGMEGKVAAGHCCSLSAVSDEIAGRVIAKCKDAGLHIVTLPSCNLYLMGRTDKQPMRRGVTRVREFLAAGVNVAYASDNIRDPFRPYGNADLLEEALLTAQVLQMGTPSELNQVYEMGTYNPAKALDLQDYGVEIGNKADLIILEAGSPSEAIIGQATKAYVLKHGKVIAKTVKETTLYI